MDKKHIQVGEIKPQKNDADIL